jgi:hypothetical protein
MHERPARDARQHIADGQLDAGRDDTDHGGRSLCRYRCIDIGMRVIAAVRSRCALIKGSRSGGSSERHIMIMSAGMIVSAAGRDRYVLVSYTMCYRGERQGKGG